MLRRFFLLVLFLVPSAAWATCTSPCVVSATCQTSGTTCTTSAVDTTGANFISIQYAGIDPVNTCVLTVTDNKTNGNATLLTGQTSSVGGVGVQIGYWTNPTVGANHTFTVTATICANAFTNFFVEAYSGMATSTPLDAGSARGTGTTGVATLAAGSFTPSQNCDVTVAMLGLNTGATSQSVTINGSANIVYQVDFSNSNWFGGTTAYLKETNSAAYNPTFSWTGNANAAVAAATFKSASTSCTGGGSTAHRLSILGVGR